MSSETIITAIDLGTDKCVTLIGRVSSETKTLKVLGVSTAPSRGMKKSQIIDLEQVLETINESLDGAERMAGLEVSSVYMSVAGTHIASLNSKGVVAVASPNQEISRMDVDRVIEAARAISLPSDKEAIHVIPNYYKVDAQDGIRDPIGMTGVRLEAEAHIITAMTTALRNIQKCAEDLGLTVSGFVFSGLAAAEVVLSDTEKELGVALVDIGAGSTSVCAYVDGALVYSASLPIGARHITQDIALGCRVSLDVAEKIKLSLSGYKEEATKPHAGESKTDYQERKRRADELPLSDLTMGQNTDLLSKKTIIEGIMAPRMQEIFSLVEEKLDAQNILDKIPAGIVLTGGGAETAEIVAVARHELKLPARIGIPNEVAGLTGDIHKPSFATSIGLLQYGKMRGGEQVKTALSFGAIFKDLNGKNMIHKGIQFIKTLLP
ncbi:cell division protein FtsA [Candidatus Woesebacteria bacterium]|nr:cell division protein FtsA [Candidatus Woesebacteria bacterium]